MKIKTSYKYKFILISMFIIIIILSVAIKNDFVEYVDVREMKIGMGDVFINGNRVGRFAYILFFKIYLPF
jgi:hypothetical protein